MTLGHLRPQPPAGSLLAVRVEPDSPEAVSRRADVVLLLLFVVKREHSLADVGDRLEALPEAVLVQVEEAGAAEQGRRSPEEM